MKAIEVTQRYHNTWNGRDADALVAAFTKDGIFCNPDTYPGVSGEALAEFVNKVWTAFPDFRIELLNAGEIEPGVVAHHWIINCTNTGQGMDGSAPTGRAFTFKGASIIQVEGNKILSDQCILTTRVSRTARTQVIWESALGSANLALILLVIGSGHTNSPLFTSQTFKR